MQLKAEQALLEIVDMVIRGEGSQDQFVTVSWSSVLKTHYLKVIGPISELFLLSFHYKAGIGNKNSISWVISSSSFSSR